MNNGLDRPFGMKGTILSFTPWMSDMNPCRGLPSMGGGLYA